MVPTSNEKLDAFSSPNHLESVLVDHSAASKTSVPVGLPVRGRRFYLVPVVVTWVEAVRAWSVSADANPILL